jgi:hypothetical protein
MLREGHFNLQFLTFEEAIALNENMLLLTGSWEVISLASRFDQSKEYFSNILKLTRQHSC